MKTNKLYPPRTTHRTIHSTALHCNVFLAGVRFDAPPEVEAATDIAIRVELKTVEASIFMIVSPANEKIVSEYVIENR